MKLDGRENKIRRLKEILQFYILPVIQPKIIYNFCSKFKYHRDRPSTLASVLIHVTLAGILKMGKKKTNDVPAETKNKEYFLSFYKLRDATQLILPLSVWLALEWL